MLYHENGSGQQRLHSIATERDLAALNRLESSQGPQEHYGGLRSSPCLQMFEQNVELTLSICADSQWVWSQLRLYFKDRKINMGEFDQLSAYVCLSSAPQIFLTHF